MIVDSHRAGNLLLLLVVVVVVVVVSAIMLVNGPTGEDL